jgi:hypothetical protein
MRNFSIHAAMIFLCFAVVTAEAKRKKKPRFKPYYLVSTELSDYQSAVSNVREKITASSFELLGEYSPIDDRTIFAITNDKLLNVASQTDFGGYGAVIRVAITKNEGRDSDFLRKSYLYVICIPNERCVRN